MDGCDRVIDFDADAKGAQTVWKPSPGAGRYEVLVFGAGDGGLQDRGETRDLRFVLPDAGSAPAVAALAGALRQGYGTFVFTLY